jgi:hypothetical protein
MADPYRPPVADSDQPDTQRALVERGRALVIAVIVPSMAATLIVFAAMPRISSFVRTLLTALLLYFLYRGKRWARAVFVILYGLAIVFALATIDFTRTTLDFWRLYLAGMPVVYLVSIIILTASPAVSAFMYTQRNARALGIVDQE